MFPRQASSWKQQAFKNHGMNSMRFNMCASLPRLPLLCNSIVVFKVRWVFELPNPESPAFPIFHYLPAFCSVMGCHAESLLARDIFAFLALKFGQLAGAQAGHRRVRAALARLCLQGRCLCHCGVAGRNVGWTHVDHQQASCGQRVFFFFRALCVSTQHLSSAPELSALFLEDNGRHPTLTSLPKGTEGKQRLLCQCGSKVIACYSNAVQAAG